MSKNYYFHPSYEAYLEALEGFAKACGGISRESALMYELQSTQDSRGALHPEQLSADWQKVFYDPQYYGGSIKRLKSSIAMKRDGYSYKDKHTGELIEVIGTRKAWRILRAAAQAADIKKKKKKDDDPEAWERYGRFYNMMTSLEAVCDLRAQLYRWIKSDRAKMAKGQATITPDPSLVADKNWQPIDMLSVERIFEKYDELLVKRKKKAGK